MSDVCQLYVCQTSDARRTTNETANFMQRITIRLPDQQLTMIDYMVAQGEFPSASEAIRAAVRELIDERSSKLIQRSEMLAAIS
ncbi:MAG: ribbon-helix-helix domain-containing protein [Methanosarcinaceae archaeon]|nr:ribbon-helix-helix domain-containing protein [Methanosarcinaceae archaeon]